MGSSFLSEFTTPQIRRGLPIPLPLSLAPTAAPGHSSAQRLSRQRFSALARLRSARHCKICDSFMEVKRTNVVASGLQLGAHFSLELVESTRPEPRHARHLADAETPGEFVPGACDLLELRPWPIETGPLGHSVSGVRVSARGSFVGSKRVRR